MRKIYTLLFAFTFLLFFSNPINSQNHLEGGISLGYTNYFGDLVEPVFTFNNPHPAAQLFLRKNFDAQHSYRLNIMYAKISGSDANYERNAMRGVSFENTFFEISSMGEIDLFGKKRYPRKGRFVKATTPYLLLGIGFLLGEPDVTYSADLDNVDQFIDYPEWHVVIPAGFGVKRDIAENMFVALEFVHRVTLSDNLDGVQLSGNAYHNDSYFFGGLSFGYRFVANPNGVPMTIEGTAASATPSNEPKEKSTKEKKAKKEKVKKEKKGKEKKEKGKKEKKAKDKKSKEKSEDKKED